MRTSWLTAISLASTLALGTPLGACAALAGLSDYADGVVDASASSATAAKTRDAGGNPGQPDAAAAETDDATGSDAVLVGDDTSADDAAGDLGDLGDASASAPDGDDTSVADAAVDGGEDAAAVCLAQCGGCCDSNAVCHGGQSVDTCGANGGACQDCSASGKACGSAGACVATSQADAGSTPKSCTASKCTNRCSLLEAPCCKSDKTCGCAVLGLVLCN